jgi:hypothetical protein
MIPKHPIEPLSQVIGTVLQKIQDGLISIDWYLFSYLGHIQWPITWIPVAMNCMKTGIAPRSQPNGAHSNAHLMLQHRPNQAATDLITPTRPIRCRQHDTPRCQGPNQWPQIRTTVMDSNRHASFQGSPLIFCPLTRVRQGDPSDPTTTDLNHIHSQ